MISSKIRVNYFATTELMRFCKSALSLSILQALCGPQEFLNGSHCNQIKERFILPLLKENFENVLRQKRAVRVITSCMRLRRIRRAALLKRVRKHEQKIVLLQSVIRGHLARVRNAAAVKRIKTEAPKKTKKYQQISKL